MPPLLVLYDGHCPLCHSFIRLLLRFEPKGQLKFASLQSDLGKGICEDYKVPPGTDSVIFLEHNKLWLHEEAVFKLAAYCNAPLSWVRIARILPSAVNRFIYKLVAAHRKKWFGAYETCILPSAEHRNRFIA